VLEIGVAQRVYGLLIGLVLLLLRRPATRQIGQGVIIGACVVAVVDTLLCFAGGSLQS
jgi:hypothetical protein